MGRPRRRPAERGSLVSGRSRPRPRGPPPAPRTGSRRGTCPRARGSRACRRRRTRPPRPRRTGRAAARRRRASTRPSRSVSRPPSVLRVRTCSLTAMSGPAVGVEQPVRRGDADEPVAQVAARAADRGDLQVLGERVGRSRGRGRRPRARPASRSSSGSSVSAFMPVDELARRSRSTTKSAPWSHERLHRRRRARPTRGRARSRTLLPVRSGFCSEPESANSFSMIRWVSTNQVWSWPVRTMCASVPSVSKPGNSGAGSRRPVASSHSDDGPGRMRMPCPGQIGSQFCDALGVVPHPVAVDQSRAGRLGDREHAAVDVRRARR